MVEWLRFLLFFSLPGPAFGWLLLRAEVKKASAAPQLTGALLRMLFAGWLTTFALTVALQKLLRDESVPDTEGWREAISYWTASFLANGAGFVVTLVLCKRAKRNSGKQP